MDTPSSHGVVASDPQNSADPKGIHTRSFFSDKDLGYRFYCTLPFGEVRPFAFFESVPDDKRIRAQFLSSVNSYTLKAPLMQGIHMKKLLVQVPRESILPMNWEKWFKNPVIGQDLANVAPDAGTSVLGFWHFAYRLLVSFKSQLPVHSGDGSVITTVADVNNFAKIWFLYLLVAEMFYSDGNLLKYCGISGSPWCYSLQVDGHTHNTVDYVFDKFVNRFLGTWLLPNGVNQFVLILNGNEYYTVDLSIDPNRTYPSGFISFREALSLMRDNLNFAFDFTGMTAQQISEVDNFVYELEGDVEYDLDFVDDTAPDSDKVCVDLKRLWAYQLSVAHFLTNDSVDYIYTAELFRQYVYQLATGTYTASQSDYARAGYFTVNGMQYQYDYLSAYYFKLVVNYIISPSGNVQPRPDNMAEALGYLCSLFSFKRSLRYLDYFTGSKTRPLAVGDVNVQVNSGFVNVVDTQAKSFLARFLNVINRVGMRNYVEGVFGVRQAPDWHNPQYLVKLDDLVTGERVENTGDKQWDPQYPNSVTSLLHGSSDRFAFEMDFDRSSVVIGLVWFDIDRVYSMATERVNLHYDRFDEFQPFMQYTGDQSLMRVELGSPIASGSAVRYATDPFGYKLRNSEYKERFDQCAGGFCGDALDGYIFKADVLESSGIQNQSPSFIRSFPSELDRFYLSETGYSLATYFHFIVKFTNLFSGSRPMAFAPTLL